MLSLCQFIITCESKLKEDLKWGMPASSFLYYLFGLTLPSTDSFALPFPPQPWPLLKNYEFLIYSGSNVSTHSPKIFTAFTTSEKAFVPA